VGTRTGLNALEKSKTSSCRRVMNHEFSVVATLQQMANAVLSELFLIISNMTIQCR
jgi:hypothetical protein